MTPQRGPKSVQDGSQIVPGSILEFVKAGARQKVEVGRVLGSSQKTFLGVFGNFVFDSGPPKEGPEWVQKWMRKRVELKRPLDTKKI